MLDCSLQGELGIDMLGQGVLRKVAHMLSASSFYSSGSFGQGQLHSIQLQCELQGRVDTYLRLPSSEEGVKE